MLKVLSKKVLEGWLISMFEGQRWEETQGRQQPGPGQREKFPRPIKRCYWKQVSWNGWRILEPFLMWGEGVVHGFHTFVCTQTPGHPWPPAYRRCYVSVLLHGPGEGLERICLMNMASDWKQMTFDSCCRNQAFRAPMVCHPSCSLSSETIRV